jgi:DNA helicase II / ATP-dependent DNA helicase PcrA
MINICGQRQKVLDATEHCLVLGGTGSGKTTLALLKAQARLRDIVVPLAPGQQVLFLSFSRAAVARIADAVKGEIKIEPANAFSIQTFHSFFWRMLQGYGYLIGAPRRLSIFLAHDEKAMSDGIERNSPQWAAWDEKRKLLFHTEGRVCFDLFAPLTAEIFRASVSIRRRVASTYPLILVDEAQDTSTDQWECIRFLSQKSQIICLADPDQMIFDYLPGVGKERIGQIRASFKPLEIDFQTENNRSSTTEIAEFARDVLHVRVKGSSYRGVSRMRFHPRAGSRDKAIRQSVGVLSTQIKKQIGRAPESIAIVASYTKGVAIISAALQQEKAIRHEVLFDEAFCLLAGRIAAFLLEPKFTERKNENIAILLDLASEAFRSKGTATAGKISLQCLGYASRCRSGEIPRYALAIAAAAVLEMAQGSKLSGEPKRDWATVKAAMRAAGGKVFGEISDSLDYLVAFGRGKLISDSLSSIWMEYGVYRGARQAVDEALSQEQILSAGGDMRGIQVMNIHKCKGKQFDGVILYRQEHHSPFVWRDETPPHESSRRLLHMGITRARYHVLMLDEASSRCPILSPHIL